MPSARYRWQGEVKVVVAMEKKEEETEKENEEEKEGEEKGKEVRQEE